MSTTDELKEELDYFIKHQDALVEKYNGRYLVIKNKKVIGDYDSAQNAYEDMINKKVELGTFLIQKCEPGEDAYTLKFPSIPIFS